MIRSFQMKEAGNNSEEEVFKDFRHLAEVISVIVTHLYNISGNLDFVPHFLIAPAIARLPLFFSDH